MLRADRNKASKIQKLAFRCFLLTSAKVKKFQDGDQSTRLYTAVFPEPRHGTHVEAKRTHFQFCQVTDRQTYRHTDRQIAIALRLRSG